jgi:hypothetical protein
VLAHPTSRQVIDAARRRVMAAAFAVSGPIAQTGEMTTLCERAARGRCATLHNRLRRVIDAIPTLPCAAAKARRVVMF